MALWSLIGLICVLPAVQGAIQSSTWNSNIADLAVDRDYTSCSQTGYQIGAWWMIDLGRTMRINVTAVTALSTATVSVRIGERSSSIGSQDGFLGNIQCRSAVEISPAAPTRITCNSPMSGRYLSIQIAEVAVKQLQLCEVEIS